MKKMLCLIGIHNYEISKYFIFKDKKCKIIKDIFFKRECKICGIKQELKKPKKYHPTKYIWN